MGISDRKAVTMMALIERNISIGMRQLLLIEQMVDNYKKEQLEEFEWLQESVAIGVDSITDELDEGLEDQNIDLEFIIIDRRGNYDCSRDD